MIANDLGRTPTFTLLGMALGAISGPLFGLLLGVLCGAYDVAILGHAQTMSFLGLPFKSGLMGEGVVIGMALGQVAGTLLDTRRQR
jgi:hypothetical protein